MKRFKLFSLIALAVLVLNACQDELSVQPHNGTTFEGAVNSVAGLKKATSGVYGLLVKSDTGYRSYMSFVLNALEMGSDNELEYITTPDPLQYNFDYNRIYNVHNLNFIWQRSYKIIYSANQNIEGINKLINNVNSEKKVTLNQLKGENLFLRAMTYLNLVRLFGRPYNQQPSQNLGVPLVDSARTDVKPSRASVKKVYNQIVNDLKSAAQLMTVDKSSSYATKQAAQALLSRVYLDMEKNQDVIDYSNKVINSGRFALLSTSKYPNYFSMDNESNSETVFVVDYDKDQDFKFGSYAAMFFISGGGVGWGAMGPSQSLLDLLNKHPNDIRNSFIKPVLLPNGTQKTYNGIKQYFITKFTGQNGIPTLSSKPYLRLAEMYLNRAEARAKLGQYKKAMQDVNTIRKRAGLNSSALYNANNMNPDSVLNAVLQERRIEFYQEGYRIFDLFRNRRAMKRNYPSATAGQLTIQPDQKNAIYPIPSTAIDHNSNLKQNPGYK